MSIHSGICCDLCRKINISGCRYKCLICNDYDLCSTCYEKKSRIHSHPMQLIITSNDYEHIYFGSIHTKHSSFSLTCPLCNQNGFSLNLLIKHINDQHIMLIYSVLCPICFLRQNNLSQHLSQHTEENLIEKIKIPNLNETEFESLIKPAEHSLLDKIINHYENKNENEQRNLFIHSLLTDIFSRKYSD
jgi:hypothetical protein